MKPKSSEVQDFENEIFNVLDKPLRKGYGSGGSVVLYKKTPKSRKPRQLMILWSSKNNPVVECNKVIVTCRQPANKSKFDGTVAGKSIKKQLLFFDSDKLHKFKKMKIKRIEGKLPVFEISGENNNEKINFKVNLYSHSSWKFKRNVLGFLPSNMVCNEYPATISDLYLTDKKSGKNILIKGLDSNVGNAEHTTGRLFKLFQKT